MAGSIAVRQALYDELVDAVAKSITSASASDRTVEDPRRAASYVANLLTAWPDGTDLLRRVAAEFATTQSDDPGGAIVSALRLPHGRRKQSLSTPERVIVEHLRRYRNRSLEDKARFIADALGLNDEPSYSVTVQGPWRPSDSDESMPPGEQP